MTYPKANAATMSRPCVEDCECFAEFDMSDWNGDENYQSCLFKEGTVPRKTRLKGFSP